MNFLLDLDGTLTDSRPGIVASIQHAQRSIGHEAPEESALIKYVGPPLHAAFRELLPEYDDAYAHRAVAAYRERFTAIGMFENSVYAGIPQALDLLRDSGARLFVATSKPRVFAQRILEHFELRHYFDDVFGSELDGRLTDKVDLIAHVVAQAKLQPTHTTMIGDRLHDVVGAIKNGVRPIGVLWGYGSREELVSAGAETLLAAPTELARLAR